MVAGLGESMTSERRLEAVDRQKTALELRKSGRTFPEIAEHLGISVAGAHKAVQTALRKTLQEPADEYRALHVARYEQIIKTNWRGMLAGDPRATDAVFRAMKGIADTIGLNAPKEAKVVHEHMALAERVAADLGMNAADVLAEAERIVAAAGVAD